MKEEIDSALTTMERIQAKAQARTAIVQQIAQMLYESGEMLAETEIGGMPTWDAVLATKVIQLTEDTSTSFHEEHSAAWSIWLDHTHRAEALLRLDADQSLTLAKILIDSAMHQQNQLELDLWRKVERAKGFEPGSLTGKPGVKQQVAL